MTQLTNMARAMAAEMGDDFDKLPADKREWTATQGGNPFRDINLPMRSDYLAMAEAGLRAIREPSDEMYRASLSALIPAVVEEANAGRHCYIRGRRKVQLRWQAMLDSILTEHTRRTSQSAIQKIGQEIEGE